MNRRYFATVVFASISFFGLAQCPTLSTSISVDFSANGVCAPVSVNTFDVTYTFNTPQVPGDIEIIFVWNDPGNTTEVVDLGDATQFFVTNGNRTFQGIASPFPYPDGGPECFFEAQAFIRVNGDLCENSEQTQIVPSWNEDDQNGAGLDFNPGQYEFCEGTAINNVSFVDASVFNCNPAANPDNPNNLERHTQFVYGTNTGLADANRIKNISIDDGGAVQLTDAAGAYTGTTTINGVTAAYFGPVVNVPFPAANPNNQTFDISAPADVNNLPGNTFTITLYNWNTCNPYNGNPASPNYADAISETVELSFIAPPNPSFIARDGGAGGPALAEFCIGENIYFDNQTGGGFNFFWEFFDGPNDTDPSLGTSTANNPTFQFANGGVKLVRLIATDNNADGNCDVVFDGTVTLTPDAVADFEFYDATFTSIINPDFCQTGTDIFTVGFRDNTVDVANTEYRYEFYDESNALISTEPTDGSFLSDPVPDFTRTFTAEEFVRVRLVAQSTVGNLCSSIEQDTIFVYGQPIPTYASNIACESERTTFSAIADQTTAFTRRVNDDIINQYEWDFSYDGVTFNSELTRNDDNDFQRFIDGIDGAAEPAVSAPGSYVVALRTTSQKGGCSELFVDTVTVNPNPESQLSSNFTAAVCPRDLIQFFNTSSNDPALGTEYVLEITSPLPSSLTIVMDRPDTLLGFDNPTAATLTYQAVLIAQTDDLCETTSTAINFDVLPEDESGFDDLNYDIFNSNCSPWSSTLVVDASTLALTPDSFTWTISEDGNPLAGYPVTTTSSTLDYSIQNTSNAIRNLEILLEVASGTICIANDTFNIQVSPQPFSEFTLNRVEDCEEVVFELEAEQKGLTQYDWVFTPAPDVVFGVNDQQLISYNRDVATGADLNVTISFTTSNLASCLSETADTTLVVERKRPEIVADFILARDTVQLPDATLSITNTSTPDDPTYSYLWDFGDGTTTTERNPITHTYTNFGSFIVSLTVQDAFCEVETFQTVFVLPADPVIDFEADTLQGCTPLTIQFTNLSQSAEPGDFVWEFGDGSVSRLDNPVHTYFDGGDYTVRLRGTNNVGTTLETEKRDYIKAFGRPFADFLASSRVVYIPDQEVYFRNLSDNSVSYFWDFGDGNTSTDESPRHAYLQEGFYDIMLVATNELGCSDTLFRDAEIEAVIGGDVSSPNAFTPNLSGPSGGLAGERGELNVNSVNDIFLPRLEGVVRFRMLVYNKWGQLLFESNNRNIGWDGYYNGKLAPAGVYIYKLELKYSDGRTENKAGDVTLIR